MYLTLGVITQPRSSSSCLQTLGNMGYSKLTCALAAVYLILDTAQLTHFRFIFLDSFLLFFQVLALFAYSALKQYDDQPYFVSVV